MVMGPKHKPAERTEIYEPKTKDLLTDEQKIREATIQVRSTHKEQGTTTSLGSKKSKTTAQSI